MTRDLKDSVEYLMKRFGIHEGEWPGIEVFCSAEGRSIWGLLPDDVYATLIVIQREVLGADDSEDDNDDSEEE
jgi:hypothetical protein